MNVGFRGIAPGTMLRTSRHYLGPAGRSTAAAFRQATCHSGVDVVWEGELLLVLCSAVNPANHPSEGNENWARRWYLLLRPSGRLCWVNELQLQMYEVVQSEPGMG